MSKYIDNLKRKHLQILELLSETIEKETLETSDIIAFDNAYKAICNYCDWKCIPTEYISVVISLSLIYINNNKLIIKMLLKVPKSLKKKLQN